PGWPGGTGQADAGHTFSRPSGLLRRDRGAVPPGGQASAAEPDGAGPLISCAKISTKDTTPVPESFAPVVAAFARDGSVSREKRFSSSNVLSVNGKIFAMLVKGK